MTDKFWDGDLKDLIINNEMHSSVAYFQNVVSHPIDKFLIHVSSSGAIGIYDGYKKAFKGIDIKSQKVMDALDFMSNSVRVNAIPSCLGDIIFERADFLYTFNGTKWLNKKINNNGCATGRFVDCNNEIGCLDDVTPILSE